MQEQFNIPTQEWVSNEELKDPDLDSIEVTGWQLLIRPVTVQQKTKSGFTLPVKDVQDIQYLTNVGRVLKAGPLCYQHDKFKELESDKIIPWCKVGDYVAFGRNSGMRFKYQGVKVVLLSDDKVLFKIDNPEDLDTSYNISSQ
jgi:co-chaperonin GroES (HSP10)